jgi:hypothetical protein
VPWPTPQDYNEALQNPAASFIDPELRKGSPQLGTLGLPKAISGGFASVYRVRSGSSDIAVRCFLKELPDQQERYAAISRHLSTSAVPETVRFEYQCQGVRVGARAYPILKMEWVDGTTLDRYISANLSDRGKLAKVAEGFLALLQNLAAKDVAHGDLQHGNILVSDRSGGPSIKVIDYDGMWVPALANARAHELGHPNYQHPNRNADTFGPYLDAFSAWSILASLLGVLVDPRLWSSVRRGDEQLLFARTDYLEPWNSDALAALRDLLTGELETVPQQLFDLSLASDITHFKSPRTDFELPGPTSSAPASAGPWWQPAPGSAVVDHAVPLAGGNDWWAQPTELRRFDQTFRRDRLLILLSLAASSILVLGGLSSLLAPAAAVALVAGAMAALSILLVISYVSRPEFAEKRRVESVVKGARDALRDAEVLLENRRREELRATQKEQQAVKTSEAEGVAAVADETKSLRRIDKQLAEQLATLRNERGALDKAEAAELDRGLRALRDRELTMRLQRASIANAGIPGIGNTLVGRLASMGIRSAADFTGTTTSYRNSNWGTKEEVDLQLHGGRSVHVDGIGAAKAEALDHWRRAVVAEVSRGLPAGLPASEATAIRTKYTDRKRAVEQRQKEAEQASAKQRASIVQSARERRERASGVLRTAQQALSKAREPYRTAIQNAEHDIGRRRADLVRANRQLDPYVLIRASVFLRLVVIGWVPRRQAKPH